MFSKKLRILFFKLQYKSNPNFFLNLTFFLVAKVRSHFRDVIVLSLLKSVHCYLKSVCIGKKSLHNSFTKFYLVNIHIMMLIDKIEKIKQRCNLLNIDVSIKLIKVNYKS